VYLQGCVTLKVLSTQEFILTLAGIYPREPRNKKKASKSSTASTTFYYTRDIQYLLHEPVLQKFREHKTFSKKLSRALGRGDVSTASRLEKTSKPSITLDHIIKERYPTFVDALRDLDDALSMLYLFANLPATSTVPPKTIALCERLVLEFEHYLIQSHSLRKSFLSIKGIYYQATIQGQDIMWLVPYKFAQRVTGDVDFRIMGTFTEFYTTLLGFVNFRLYNSIGLLYPPKFDVTSDEAGGGLRALTLEGRGAGEVLRSGESNGTTKAVTNGTSKQLKSLPAKIAELTENGEDEDQTVEEEEAKDPEETEATDAMDTFEAPISADADTLVQPQFADLDGPGSLFAPYTFYLSRETPRGPLEFLLRAFGCKRIGWDAVLGDGAFTTNESDPSITHQIVDRPPIAALPPAPEDDDDVDEETQLAIIKKGTRVPGRTYIQPQWVWDSINSGKLLRPDTYAPGATLPPHLSPWVKVGKGGYDPSIPLAEQEREGEAEEASSDEEEVDAGEDEEMVDQEEVKSLKEKLIHDGPVEAGEGMDIASGDDDSEEEDEEEDEKAGDWDGLSDAGSEEEEDEATIHQRELEAEASGLPFSSSLAKDDKTDPKAVSKKKRDELRKKSSKKRKEEEEELERQKMMMPRKKRKILDKMLYSNKKKEVEAEKLRGKRRKIEKAGKAI
jgi:pescadillo